MSYFFFFFQAEDGIRDIGVTGVQTCALPISPSAAGGASEPRRYRRPGPMRADDQTSGEPMLAITNAAYDKVMSFLLQEAEPERQAMWLEVTGTSANQW